MVTMSGTTHRQRLICGNPDMWDPQRTISQLSRLQGLPNVEFQSQIHLRQYFCCQEKTLPGTRYRTRGILSWSGTPPAH